MAVNAIERVHDEFHLVVNYTANLLQTLLIDLLEPLEECDGVGHRMSKATQPLNG